VGRLFKKWRECFVLSLTILLVAFLAMQQIRMLDYLWNQICAMVSRPSSCTIIMATTVEPYVSSSASDVCTEMIDRT
jgi:hypothetical protein